MRKDALALSGGRVRARAFQLGKTYVRRQPSIMIRQHPKIMFTKPLARHPRLALRRATAFFMATFVTRLRPSLLVGRDQRVALTRDSALLAAPCEPS